MADTAGPTLLYAIKQVELAVRAAMDRVLRPLDVTVAQYTALTVLRRRDGLSSAQLARNSFVTAQTMGEMIATLEKRGLVTRTSDPGNRRRMLTHLTTAARDMLEEYDAAIAAVEETMLAELTDGERNELRRYLSTCRSALSDRSGHRPNRPGDEMTAGKPL